MRSELNAVEKTEHLAKRKELWEVRQTGGAGCTTCLSDGRGAGPQHSKRFAQETAEATGVSKSTISSALSRAELVCREAGGDMRQQKCFESFRSDHTTKQEKLA